MEANTISSSVTFYSWQFCGHWLAMHRQPDTFCLCSALSSHWQFSFELSYCWLNFKKSSQVMCGPQPLQRISASWYRPMHHLGLCAIPMLRCSSFLAYTPNWPVALFLLLLHPPGTLYLLTFDCVKTFSLSNVTWKPIYSNSLSPPVLHQAPLYLRT